MTKHIIISRIDNIGDVVLTLPMAAIIKAHFPHCKISFLARDYVKDIVQMNPHINAFISWDSLQTLTPQKAAQTLAATKADTIIHVSPNQELAKIAKKARIAKRIGTQHRLYHWWTCNRRVAFSRKNSVLHEAQLNLLLLKPLGIEDNYSLTELSYLAVINKKIQKTPEVIALLDAQRFNLILHPFTNGNTKEWPLENFIKLIKGFSPQDFHIIITGTKAEASRLAPLFKECPQVTDAVGLLTLNHFVELLGQADGVVVNSTGPLHIAAALGTPVLGFFPPQKGKNPERWGPLGIRAQYLVAEKCNDCKRKNTTLCTCMTSISISRVQAIVETWRLKKLES
jgi:heptosyltransferase-3